MTQIDKSTKVVDIQKAVLTATETLRNKGLETVDPGFAAEIVAALFTERVGGRYRAGRSTRVRTTPALISEVAAAAYATTVHPEYTLDNTPPRVLRTCRNAAKLTGRLLKWHTGSGDLHSLFAVKWECAPELFHPLETLAQTILVLSGHRSAALAAWEATGLIGRP